MPKNQEQEERVVWSNEPMGGLFGDEPFVREDLRGELEDMLQEYVDADDIPQRWAEVIELVTEWMETCHEEAVERVLGPLSNELATWEPAIQRPAEPDWLELVDAGEPGAKQLVELTNAPGGFVLALMRWESELEERLEVAVLIDESSWVDALDRVPVSGADLLEKIRASRELSNEQLLDGWSLRVYSCRWGVVDRDFVEIDAPTMRSWVEAQPVALYKPGESLLARLKELSMPDGARPLGDFWPSYRAEDLWGDRLEIEGEIAELAMDWTAPERPPAPSRRVTPPAAPLRKTRGGGVVQAAVSRRKPSRQGPPPVPFAQRSLIEQWGELRSLLSTTPEVGEEGLKRWYKLQSMLKHWRQPDALGEEVVPYVSSRLQGWPQELIRSASPAWVKLHDGGDPLGEQLLELTNAPGGYVLERGLSVAGYEHPSNGAIWLDAPGEAIGHCESFLQEAAWSVVGVANALGSDFSLWRCRWGCIQGPRHPLRFEHDPIDDTLPEPEPHRTSGLPAIRFAPLPDDLGSEPEGTVDFHQLESTHDSTYGHACIEFAGDIDEVFLY